MQYEKFDLEKAKAGKPFGVVTDGEFNEVLLWHYFKNLDKSWPLRCIFKDGTQDGFSLSDTSLVMLPEEKSYYCNVYKDGVGDTYGSIEKAEESELPNKIGRIKITIIGNDFKVEKI